MTAEKSVAQAEALPEADKRMLNPRPDTVRRDLPLTNVTPNELTDGMAMVRRIVGKISQKLPRHLRTGDLEGAGRVGLMQAAKIFDRKLFRGPFADYAYKRVRGEIIDELRRGDIVSRQVRQKAKETGEPTPRPVDFDAALRFVADPTDDLETQYLRSEQIALMQRALAALNERERKIYTKRFVEEKKELEIAKEESVSEARISQILTRIREKMEAFLRKMETGSPNGASQRQQDITTGPNKTNASRIDQRELDGSFVDEIALLFKEKTAIKEFGIKTMRDFLELAPGDRHNLGLSDETLSEIKAWFKTRGGGADIATTK